MCVFASHFRNLSQQQEQCTGAVYWSSVLEQCIGAVYRSSVQEQCTGAVYRSSVLEQCTGAVYWSSVLEQCTGGARAVCTEGILMTSSLKHVLEDSEMILILM
jgi:hypothetical protein